MQITVLPADRLSQPQKAAWSALQQADASLDNPFLRPELAELAQRVCGNVEVAVIGDVSAPAGFFPFQREQPRVGRPVIWQMSDLHGMVARPGLQLDAVELLRGCDLAAWKFDHLVASQELFRPHHGSLDDSPYMDLTGGFEAYAQERRAAGSSVVSQSDRKRRKLHREVGPVRFEWHNTSRAVVDELVAMKSSQLRAQGYLDVFQYGWLREMVRHLIDYHSPDFAGVLSVLWAGDRPAAIHLAMHSRHVLSSWIPAYDADLAAFSPGLILHVELARAAAGRGVTRIDLCRGYNQLKRTLMSGAYPVALGAVDRRPVGRLLNRAWHCARGWAHATPLRGAPLQIFRRMRTWAARTF